ncbi:hypothetical protein M426DRAFT_318935 [Hypoxylon sp. CI-4A]|nr:hypothetical protein M426DRAFT_318935 [Hypoxylon sp. CI-4A]
MTFNLNNFNILKGSFYFDIVHLFQRYPFIPALLITISTHAKGVLEMDKLPPELLRHILNYTVIAHHDYKNDLLELRTTCKTFDEILKPYALQTLQLDFTRLDRRNTSIVPPDNDALHRAARFCRALYLDMMVVRDDAEVKFLSDIFTHFGDMEGFVSELRTRYCMNDQSFTEIEYRHQLGHMLECAPDVTALKLHLPFQLVSPGQYRAATIILGNTLEALVQRPEESETLKTLVLENLSDLSVVSLWRNPQDVRNIISVFSNLRRLFLSVRRSDESYLHTINFRKSLWEMIGKAEKLDSLCLVDLDVDERPEQNIKTSLQQNLSHEDWRSKALPPPLKQFRAILPNLTFLELRQLEIMACDLVCMFESFTNLKELHMDGVFLKTVYNSESPNANNTLWIGLPNVPPPADHLWIATHMRKIRAQLRVCLVSNLGYDQYMMGEPPENELTYDLEDPSGLSRSLDLRFVEVAMGIKQPAAPDGTPITYLPDEGSEGLAHDEDYNANYHLTTQQDPTSAWHQSIDGHFKNRNRFTIETLHTFAENACKGMRLLNAMRERQQLRQNDSDI